MVSSLEGGGGGELGAEYVISILQDVNKRDALKRGPKVLRQSM